MIDFNYFFEETLASFPSPFSSQNPRIFGDLSDKVLEFCQLVIRKHSTNHYHEMIASENHRLSHLSKTRVALQGCKPACPCDHGP